MARFSVIVPVYNGERYLARCLGAVAASIGASRDWEIVCVDDASTDATAALLAHWAAHSAVPFRVVRHESNRGIGEARNTGLAHAQGEWIAWVDADDAVTADWATQIVRSLAQPGTCDVLCFGARLWRGVRWRPMRYRPSATEMSAAQFLLDILCDVGSSTWMWNKVFRRSLFAGLRFSGRCQEDFCLTPALFDRARRVRAVPELLYDYYRPAGSLSRHGDKAGSVEGLKPCLDGPLLPPDRVTPELLAAWREGCALRAADYLRNSGFDADFRRFLRRNVWRVLLDARQSLRAKVKCALMAI